MKRAKLYEQAERQYVAGQCSFEEIAAALDVSERTLRYWADDGNWREKRAAFLHSLESAEERRRHLDQRMHDFAERLMDTIEQDWRDGNQVDPGRLYALTRMIDKLDKARKARDAAGADDKEQERDERGGLSDDALRKIEQQIGLL